MPQTHGPSDPFLLGVPPLVVEWPTSLSGLDAQQCCVAHGPAPPYTPPPVPGRVGEAPCESFMMEQRLQQES